MESDGAGIRRLDVDLADDSVDSRNRRGREYRIVERPGKAPPPRRGRDHHPVDIDEAVEAFAEPEEVGAVVCARLIEGDHQGGRILGLERQEGSVDQPREAGLVEEREFGGVVVVERQEPRLVLRPDGDDGRPAVILRVAARLANRHRPRSSVSCHGVP